MRICLLRLPATAVLGLDMITLTEPLGLECVAGALEAIGHACCIVDMRIDSPLRAMAQVRRFQPDVIGIQCNFTAERFAAVDMAERLKASLPGATIVAGGHDASREPEWFQGSAVDAVVLGDGETTLPAFVSALSTGGDPGNVPGLVLNRSDGPSFTGPPPGQCAADDLPFPARHLVREYANRYYMSFSRPLALLETARGCPFRCKFCSVWKFHNGTYRPKSPLRVIDELRQIDAPHVFITDDIFWLDPSRDREIAERIRSAGIRKSFCVQARTDTVARQAELIKFWRELGDLTIFLGLETIDDAGLDSLNKRNAAANNRLAVEILRDLGISFTANFIVDPNWRREDFAALKDWLEANQVYRAGFSILTPLPGADLWTETRDKLTTHDWRLFDLEHAVLPTRLPLGEFYEEYAGLWRHVYSLRCRKRGRAKGLFAIPTALLTGKASLTALRNGLQIGKALGSPGAFMQGHQKTFAGGAH